MNETEAQTMLWNFDQPLSVGQVVDVFPDTQTYLTRKQIAHALRRAKSPTLIARINEAVGLGLLQVHMWRLPNGVDMFSYTLADGQLRSVR